MTLRDVIQLIGAGGFIALGLYMLMAPARFGRGYAGNRDREIAARLARGEDAYFEELRTLQAYRKPPAGIRLLGILALGLGAATIVLYLTGAGQ